jgi:hypothetical protein
MPFQQKPHFLENASLRQDCSARLLLLLAKTRLTASQAEEARTLAAGVKDWNEFAKLAASKFVITYVHRHLRSIAADIVPPLCLKDMEQLAYASTKATLRVAAAQLAFHNRCIQSTGAKHAYVKGPALAAQCGQDMGERYSRDIDVLVASSDFRRVIAAAITSGYGAYVGPNAITKAQDLNFLTRYADVVTIFSPERIPIELHRRLDKRSVNFDLERALATAEEVAVSGVTLQTLSKPYHFNFICYHHSRHFWSKLHWLADVHALTSVSDFDPDEALRLADTIGIRPTIEASFEFRELTARSGLWGRPLSLDTGGSQFLGVCLFNLDGELELEQSLRKGMPFSDFMSAWQISSRRHTRFELNAWWNRLRPTPTQYFRRRLPLPLQWLYYLRNAATLTRLALVRGLHLSGRQTAQPGNAPSRSAQTPS